MPWYDENTFVIRTNDIEVMREFLENFGLIFAAETHEGGPVHYSCEIEGKVIEIYPRKAL